MTTQLRFSIDSRPTQELFFTAGRLVIRVGMDGQAAGADDDDLTYLRTALLSELGGNEDVQRALSLAKLHAESNGATLDEDFVYFD